MKFTALFLLLFFLLPINNINSQLIINEVQSSNTSFRLDSDSYDWIEIYNSGSTAIDITGYFLTDDLDNPNKWTFNDVSVYNDISYVIAPNEYLIVACSNKSAGNYDRYFHANFKLSSSGEEIYLFDSSTNLVSSLIFPELNSNESYGYDTDNNLGVFSVATMGLANGLENFTLIDEYFDPPIIDLPYQMFFGEQEVTISSDGIGDIYYTTNGENPTDESMLYNGSFIVEETSVIKAIIIKSDLSKSNIAMRTIIIDESHNLPVLNLTAENYTRIGSNSISKKPEFDGRIWVELIEVDGGVSIAQYANYTASGANSNSIPPLNGKIKASGRYGADHFENNDGMIFPNKPDIDNVYGFLLRNSSQDWGTAKLRDGFASKLVSTDNLIDFGFQDYKAVVVYLQGEYQGVLNIREDDDSLFKNNNYADESVVEEYTHNELFNKVRLTEMTDDLEREALLEIVNIRDYFFYIFHYMFLEGSEVSEYGYRIEDQKADWIVHDEDMSFQDYSVGESMDMPYNFFVQRIVAYEPFKFDLIQSLCAYSGLLYDADRTTSILDTMESEIDSEIEKTIQFYKDFKIERDLTSDFFDHMESVDDWQVNVDVIRQIINGKFDTYLTDLKTHYSLEQSLVDFVINTNNLDQGAVRIQGVKVRESSMTTPFFTNMPLELIAEPNVGYQFSHWEGISTSTSPQISVSLSEISEITAVFEPIPIETVQLVINEVQSKNDTTYVDEFGEFNDWVEIYNQGTEAVDIAGFYFSDNPSITNKYQVLSGDSSKTTVPAGGFLVLWLDKDIDQGVNHLDFKLNGSDQILLVNVDGLTVEDTLDFDLESDLSYGSKIDGEPSYVYFLEPTPNATNEGALLTNQDFDSPNEYEIFPNPTTGWINLESLKSITNVQIFDLSGRLVKTTLEDFNQIFLGDLQKGVYVLKINIDGAFVFKKIILK